LVSDYDGRDFYPYIDDKTQKTYLVYTKSTGIQVLTPDDSFSVITYGSITYTSAKLGNSAIFNNTAGTTATNYITIDSAQTNPLSISLWFNTTDGISSQNIFALIDYSLNPILSVNFHNQNASNGLVLNITGLDGNVDITSTTTQVSANIWYHLCITIDSSFNTILYINENEVGNVVSSTLSNVSSIFIGGNGNGIESFVGYIDELNIFNTAITSNTVSNLYGLGNVTSNLIAHYSFDSPLLNVYKPTVTSVTGNISATNSMLNNSGIFNNNYGELANNYITAINTINFPISTAFWFYPLNTSNVQTIVSLGNRENTNNSLEFNLQSGNLSMNFEGNIVTSNVSIIPNTWYSVFGGLYLQPALYPINQLNHS
jgi:hypothetical protein